MKFVEALNEIKRSETYSMYKPGLLGLLQIEHGILVFRDIKFKAKKPALSAEDMRADDWEIAVKAA